MSGIQHQKLCREEDGLERAVAELKQLKKQLNQNLYAEVPLVMAGRAAALRVDHQSGVIRLTWPAGTISLGVGQARELVKALQAAVVRVIEEERE